jgi:hypothetical protein
MTHVLRKPRSLSVASIALFLVAYAAVLMIVLAPKDMFIATPGSQQQADD